VSTFLLFEFFTPYGPCTNVANMVLCGIIWIWFHDDDFLQTGTLRNVQCDNISVERKTNLMNNLFLVYISSTCTCFGLIHAHHQEIEPGWVVPVQPGQQTVI